jgi:hypothetical protein
MNAFVFVSIICIGQACTFMTSTDYLSEAECQEYKTNFLQTQFSPKVTMASAQCMKFKPGTSI